MDNHLFLGSNTSKGFRGFFSCLLSSSRHAFLLKGGPGVGKSTFMRETASFLQSQGQTVQFFSCSGDPDSLDAVYAPESGILMADATAPHVLEPVFPGVRDNLINLGICLNEKQLSDQKDEIIPLQKSMKESYAHAYHLLSCAEEIMQDTFLVYQMIFPDEKLRPLQKELFSLLYGCKDGNEEHFFAQAITYKGTLNHLDAVSFEKAVCIDVPWGFDLNRLLSPLSDKMKAEHASFTVFHDPLCADRAAHLKTGSTLFTGASFKDASYLSLPADRISSASFSDRLRFDHASFELMMNQSFDALSQAKAEHDRLERYYADAMNYVLLDDIKSFYMKKIKNYL